ncbi:hypothetical protein [Nannocystis pusilla]|uniref:hypothetical protein n=1 Tax=Nannocystis pusilla TaxID=889268 RepID=UPI003B82B2FC
MAVAQQVEDEADRGGVYQALMGKLGAHRGQGAVNEVIREGVLKAWLGEHLDPNDQAALSQAELTPDKWHLKEECAPSAHSSAAVTRGFPDCPHDEFRPTHRSLDQSRWRNTALHLA